MTGMCTEKTGRGGRMSGSGIIGGRYGLFAICMTGAALLLADTQTAADGVLAGLALCAGSLIPSLFPFLVLSPMLASGANAVLCRRGNIVGAILCAFVIGMAAGFPIGALMLVSLCESGALCREDAQRLLGICSGASAAFCVGYIGEVLCESPRIGWLVWGVQVLLCLAGLLMTLPKIPPTTIAAVPIKPMPALTVCIRDAVVRMLNVAGTVVFFSVLRSFAVRYIGGIGAAAVCGLCEITGGLCEIRRLADTGMLSCMAAAVLGAGMLGFGGLCVLAQIAEAVSHAGLSLRQYLKTRLLLGIGAAGCAFALYLLYL